MAEAITEDTAAIILEPIQGEGGLIVPPEGYLQQVQALCRQKDVLLILDEIQTGFGRTGEMFASTVFGVQPDITTVAKAMGGGYPIGAILANERIASAFEPGDHVIVHSPGYQSLAEVARAAGCEVNLWPAREEKDWSLDLDELRRLMRINTRAIIINTPHNPTGQVCPKGVDPANAIQLMKRELVSDLCRLRKRRAPAAIAEAPRGTPREGIVAPPARTVTEG